MAGLGCNSKQQHVLRHHGHATSPSRQQNENEANSTVNCGILGRGNRNRHQKRPSLLSLVIHQAGPPSGAQLWQSKLTAENQRDYILHLRHARRCAVWDQTPNVHQAENEARLVSWVLPPRQMVRKDWETDKALWGKSRRQENCTSQMFLTSLGDLRRMLVTVQGVTVNRGSGSCFPVGTSEAAFLWGNEQSSRGGWAAQ